MTLLDWLVWLAFVIPIGAAMLSGFWSVIREIFPRRGE